MSYQVLARKYRPQTFEEAIGQDATTRTLQNAISQERLHHAYLFTGPRGVGKTSLARIFAKSLNCEKGPTVTPCQKCAACVEITRGSSMDVQEIDGASNTSVDDVRQLRENAKYMPSAGKHRIYIIDEVHMLSRSAFAALLKILEEPPEHVRFIFATTDPEKIPATILSRVLRFDFRRPPTPLLVEHLERIAKSEKLKIEREALLWIARNAEGSVRDALSLLDRVISFAGSTIKADDVLQALGIRGRQAVLQLLEQIIARDSEAALQFVAELYNEGQDLKQLSQEFMEAMRDVLVYKVTGDKGFPDTSQQEREAVAALAEQCQAADIEYMFHLFHRAYRDLLHSPLPKVLLEIALLRLCTRHDRQALADVIGRLDALGSNPVAAAPTQRTMQQTAQHTSQRTGSAAPAPKAAPPATAAAPNKTGKTWDAFLDFVSQKKPSLGPILAQAQWQSDTGDAIQLSYPASSTYKAMLKDPQRQKQLNQLAQTFFNKPVVFGNGRGPEPAAPPAPEAATGSILDDAIAIFNPKNTNVPNS